MRGKYKRYRGRKPGWLRQKIWRGVCIFGLILTLCAAGDADMGFSGWWCWCRFFGGIALFGLGGKLGGCMV